MYNNKYGSELNMTLRTLTYCAGRITGNWWNKMTTEKLVSMTKVLSWSDKLVGM